MQISHFTFMVSGGWHTGCTACLQEKEPKIISCETIDRAVDFFYPFFHPEDKVHIRFGGVEPLRAYEQVEHAVNRI